MRQVIPEKIRQKVAERAGLCCEYCRIHADNLFLSFEIDHIIALKHGVTNDLENLAYACPHCNQYKGTDFATLLNDFNDIVVLFNPRIHEWTKHFETIEGEIIPKTRIGQASLKIFRFNQPDLLIVRRLLNEVGKYP